MALDRASIDFELESADIALRSNGGGSLYRLQRDFVLRAASGAP